MGISLLKNSNRFIRIAASLLLVGLVSACLSDSGGTGKSDTGIDLTITSPSSESLIETADASVILTGKAISSDRISEVSWVSDRGPQGIAIGTTAWQTEIIPLGSGLNRITVTAKAINGQSTSKSITVNRTSDNPGSATLSWIAPTTRTDGSPLTDLSGYKIYYGQMSGIYDYQIVIKNPGLSSYVVENLAAGDWYFALSAYDSNLVESIRSNEVHREII